MRVFNFLVGLIPKFDQARAQILGRELFPPFMQACASPQAKDQDGVMYTPSKDRSALAVILQREIGKTNWWIWKRQTQVWLLMKIVHTSESC